jgi:hypothetical protein
MGGSNLPARVSAEKGSALSGSGSVGRPAFKPRTNDMRNSPFLAPVVGQLASSFALRKQND